MKTHEYIPALALLMLAGFSCQGLGTKEISPLGSEYGTSCAVKRPTNIQRPAEMCGSAGYEYLWTMYLRPQCGGCHYQGSFIHWNGFGDANPSTAYYFIQYYSKALFVERVKTNGFLLDDCLLREGDPLLDDLRTWFDRPGSC